MLEELVVILFDLVVFVYLFDGLVFGILLLVNLYCKIRLFIIIE